MTVGIQPSVVAVSLEPLDASTTLFLGHLAERMPGALQVVRYADPGLSEKVANASAIILVRGLFELDGVFLAARVLRIPLYYFVDDNFILLREQPGPWSPYVRRYSAANVRRRLRAFHGVLLSSDALMDYYRAQNLHSELTVFPPIEWQQQLSRPPASPHGVSIAFFGGLHLHEMFTTCILPAVRRLALDRPVTLIAAGVHDAIAPSPGLSVVEQPYDTSYARGLRRLAETGVDVLVHPSAPGLDNGRYKNPHALISANAIGAIPVVSDRPPYSDLREAGVALLCDDSPESWYAAFAQVGQPAERMPIGERLQKFCSSHYGGRINREVIDKMLSLHESPSARWRRVRTSVVRAAVLLGRLRPVMARLRPARLRGLS
ncbi:MAG: hypothetical protein Q8O42_01800 [Acidobacteriota bacterium]|nr:hypothetical protein [Acidobacteriota bacterium]